MQRQKESWQRLFTIRLDSESRRPYALKTIADDILPLTESLKFLPLYILRSTFESLQALLGSRPVFLNRCAVGFYMLTFTLSWGGFRCNLALFLFFYMCTANFLRRFMCRKLKKVEDHCSRQLDLNFKLELIKLKLKLGWNFNRYLFYFMYLIFLSA